MNEFDYYESLGIVIEAAKKSFEDFKKSVYEKEEMSDFLALISVNALKENLEEYKFKPDYSLRYIVHWLTIAMIYDYMNDKKEGAE